ncbi:pilus assembly protein [Burkholderia contaminans]|uniref:pilus assembly protein n=1 Tax=Burkholderia contaminans TaxID=488447 RepID=UPI00158B32FF|nr:pilus assembly protein [Burkholderia contaminans]
MTALAHRSALRGDGWRGGMRRVSPAAAHVAGCGLAFAAVLVGGIHLVNAADWSGLAHSRALLAAAQMREADARRVLAAAARQRGVQAAAHGDRAPRTPEWAALMLELADRAASSGLRDVSIEPLRADGAVPDGRRTVRIVADGGFHALLQMVGGLARFPVLAVPYALRVERGKEAVRVEMSVDVFPELPAPTSTGGEAPVLADVPGADPFGEAGSSEAEGAAAARLAGTIRDRRTGLALFDDGDGTFTAVVPGDTLGAARVVRVDPVTVTLATADGAYRVTLDDGRRP